MSIVVRHNVDDLPEVGRQSLEQLIGQKLDSHRRVYIIVEAPIAGPSQAKRGHATRRIQDLMARAQSSADAHGVTDHEMDPAVEKAMAHVRRRA